MILRLLIFISAFIVGISIVSWAKKLVLSDVERSELMSVVQQHEAPLASPVDDRGLLIEFAGTVRTSDGTDTVYKVTNLERETIFFNFDNGTADCRLTISSGPNRWLGGTGGCKVPARQLGPSESVVVTAPVFFQAYGFRLAVGYTVGDSAEIQRTSITWGPFSKPLVKWSQL
jgi:hypothetical protein